MALSGAARAQGGADPAWPTRQWQTATPEEQGIDSAALARLVNYGAAHSFDSLLISRHGRIVLDAYYAPYTPEIPHLVNSVTKAVTGTLVAMLLRDGVLDRLDHRMVDFFGDRTIANLDGCDWHPAFPAPLFKRGRNEEQSSDDSCRENTDAYSLRRHAPRMRGIQYAAASRLKPRRLWTTGSPAGDDTESLAV